MRSVVADMVVVEAHGLPARDQWLCERRVLSHDDIKNRWLPAAVKHLRVLSGDVIDPDFEAEHLRNLRQSLEPLLARCDAVCAAAEAALSPRVELLRPPLNELPAAEYEQLASLLHQDWLDRSDIRARIGHLVADIQLARGAGAQVLRRPADPKAAQAFCDVLQALGRQFSTLLQAAPYPRTLT